LSTGGTLFPTSASFTSGRFIEATAENWESEFLEMAGYAVLTALLFQRGSAESRKLPDEQRESQESQATHRQSVPWAVRRGGWMLKLYEHSLSLGFLLLFFVAFVLHAYGGLRDHNLHQLEHGKKPDSLLDFITTAEFWFQSFQNWQSEFLGLAAIVVMSIYLRERGSPQSKEVDAPHRRTGT
jgi:membrane protein implicated in regulation of membrane protease activity